MTWRDYLMNNILALDTLLNTLLRGRVGQTLSQRAATARRDKRRWGCILCWILDRIEANHCYLAIHNDAERARITLRDTLGEP